MKKRSLIPAIFSVFMAMITGCIVIQSDSNVQRAAEIKAAHFRQHNDYESLHWIEQNYLRVGMPASEVIRLLGKGESYGPPAPPTELHEDMQWGNRLYVIDRYDSNSQQVFWGNHFYIQFQDWCVEDWGYNSE